MKMFSHKDKQDLQRLAEGLPLEVYCCRSTSRGVTGVTISVLVSFILGALVGGFLGEMGKDCWTAIKSIVKGMRGSSSRRSPLKIEILIPMQLGNKTVRVLSAIGHDSEVDVVFHDIQSVLRKSQSHYERSGGEIVLGKVTLSVLEDDEHVKSIRNEYEKIVP